MDVNTNEQIADSNMAVVRAKKLVDISSEQHDEPSMRQMVNELEELAAKYPDVEEIEVRFAEILFNLLYVQDSEDGLKTADRLEALAAKYPDAAGITVQYAKGLAYLSYDSEGEVSSSIADRLEKVAREHPDNTMTAALYAVGLANLSYEQEGGSLFQTVGKLESLAGGYPGEMNIVCAYAEGLANMCFEDAEIVVSRAFERLKELVGEYPDSEKLMEQYERALENMESFLEDDESDDVLDTEETKPKYFCKRKLPADAGGFAAADLNQEQQDAVMKAEKLQSLFLAHPDNAEFAVEFAEGLRELCACQGMLGWQAAARLEYLSADYPEEKGVTEELAKGWILLSRAVDEMSAIAVNAKLDGLVMLNPYLADIVKDFKSELDKADR